MEQLFSKYISPLIETPIVKVADKGIAFSNIFYSLLIIGVAYGVYISAKILLNIYIKRKSIRSSQGKALLQLFGYVVTMVAVFFVIKAFGYTLSYLLLGSTALLVGLGFGLQQLFLDLVSGVIILIDKDINLGDVVKVDIPSSKDPMHGRIYHIGLRATLLQNIDNEFMIIPNSKFLASGVRSLMRDKGSARFRIHILVEFNQDMKQAVKVLMESVLKDPRVEQEPAPTIIVKEFQANGVMLEARFWMRELFNSEIILSDVRFKILEDFHANGIKIPFPHQVIIPTDREIFEYKVKAKEK